MKKKKGSQPGNKNAEKNKTKDNVIYIRCTDDEKQKWTHKAEKENKCLSVWVRDLANQ